jgi:triosephosphate isomerase
MRRIFFLAVLLALITACTFRAYAEDKITFPEDYSDLEGYIPEDIADILPEGVKDAGAVGVMINHCEKPMSLPQMKKTIDRARELDMLVFACADTLDEAKAIAQLHPDIINPEPSEIIGGGKGASPMAYVMDSIKAIKEVDPNIMVEQAAGITCGQEVYDFIMAGSEAAGAASGIMNAADPIAMIDEMIAATRRAADDLKKMEENK